MLSSRQVRSFMLYMVGRGIGGIHGFERSQGGYTEKVRASV
jgi:hypothetical protein